MQQIKRPESLTGLATRRLRDAIVNGDLTLGAPLSESQLAASLGVSKTPVREALAQLRIEGLVTTVPQKGTFVFTLSAREVIELCELRLTLETAALRFACQRHRLAFADDLSPVVDNMARAMADGDTRAYLALDTEYHERFFRHCGNRYMAQAYGLMAGRIAALRTHLASRPTHTEKSFAEHREMVETVRRGAIDACVGILERHIGRTRQSYAEHIDDIAAADRRMTADGRIAVRTSLEAIR